MDSRRPRTLPRTSQPSGRSHLSFHYNVREYNTRLEHFLKEVLSKFVFPPEIIGKLVNQGTIHIWRTAFTHISFPAQEDDVDEEANYERLETIGDASLEIGFYDYIMKVLPKVDEPSVYDELRNYYMSKEFQGKISLKLGFDRFLRKDPNIPLLNSIAEDNCESFAGALYTIGNKYGEEIVGNQIGQILVNNFVTYIFNDVEIDLERRHGSYITQLETIGRQLGIEIKYYSTQSQHQAIGAWYVSSSQFNRLISNLVEQGEIRQPEIKDLPIRQNIARTLHLHPATLVLGFSNTGSRAEVQNEAAKKSLAFLLDLGISRDVAESVQLQKLDENSQRNINRILGKYHNVKIRSLKKTAEDKGYVIYLLVGTDQFDRERTIVSLYEKKTTPFDEVRKELYDRGRKRIEEMNSR